MNKCFITKLPSSVDNDNLPVLGQLRINWSKQSNLTDNDARAIGLATDDSITIKVSGAHLTDNTLLSNLGNSNTITRDDGLVWLYVSNDSDAILTIDNKYSLTYLVFAKPGKEELKRSVEFDINDIKYCTALTFLNLANTKVSGDISAVSNLTNLINIDIQGTQVSGDISAVSNLTNLTYLSLSATQISGLIDSLSKLTKLEYITNLKYLSLTGDMSKIPTNVRGISQTGRKINTNFTWTAKGRQNANLLGIEGDIPFDTISMDNMLIDQATCTFVLAPTEKWASILTLEGSRTSASDAAVETIQNMGVTITGVTKES